jgi:hypothetical protein
MKTEVSPSAPEKEVADVIPQQSAESTEPAKTEAAGKANNKRS